MDNWMLYQVSSYIKNIFRWIFGKSFFLERLLNLMAWLVFNLQTFKTDISLRNNNHCNFIFRLPNLMNDASNKAYESIEFKEVKQLWIKVMRSSELKFNINTFILGHPVNGTESHCSRVDAA